MNTARKVRILAMIAIGLLFIIQESANAQVSFLRISPNARQVGMGEAFTGMANDYNLLRYNVGGLGLLKKAKLATNFHGWIGDTKQGDIEFSIPLFWGVGAFGLTYFSHGDIEDLNADFEELATTTSPNDIMLSFGYGRQAQVFGRKLSFGAGSKLIRQDLAGESASAIGVDVGAIYQLKYASFGATFQNFTVTKLKFIEREELLPETIRAGMGVRLPFGKKYRWNVAADIAKVRAESDYRYYTGTEVDFGKTLKVRGGYKWHDTEASRWAVGFGLNMPMEWLSNASTEIDYAFSPLDNFDEFAHRFSVTFTFNNLTPRRFTPINSEELTMLEQQLADELVAIQEARQRAEDAEERTRALEDEMQRRLEHIKQIALTSQGKIEVSAEGTEDGKYSQVHMSLRINFEFDSAEIVEAQSSTMEKVAEILNTYPVSKVWISGHTDNVGTNFYNMGLSMRRMDSVQQYLSKHGVNGSRFFMPVPYGEDRPVDTNATSVGRERNRRVDFTIFAFDQEPDIPEGSIVRDVEAFNDSTFAIICNGKVPFEVDEYQNPARVSIDLPGIYYLRDTATNETIELNRGLVKRARIAYHDEGYTRVVFDLLQKSKFNARLVDNAVIVNFVQEKSAGPSEITEKN